MRVLVDLAAQLTDRGLQRAVTRADLDRGVGVVAREVVDAGLEVGFVEAAEEGLVADYPQMFKRVK